MTERLKTKYKTDTTFSQARLSQMREDYETQLKELRQRLKTETEAAEQRRSNHKLTVNSNLPILPKCTRRSKPSSNSDTRVLWDFATSAFTNSRRCFSMRRMNGSRSSQVPHRRQSLCAVSCPRRAHKLSHSGAMGRSRRSEAGEEVVGLEKSIYELKNSLEKLKNENSKLLIEVDSLKKMKDEYQKSADSLKQSNSILENQVENLKADLEAFSSKTAKASDAGAFLQAKLDAAEKALEETQTTGRTERANLRWVWMCRCSPRRLHQRHVSLVKAFTSAELTEAKQVADTTNNLIDALRTDLATAISKNEELEGPIRARKGPIRARKGPIRARCAARRGCERIVCR